MGMRWYQNGNKYRNTKTIVDGMEFASRKEGSRYQELKLLESCGEISDLRCQEKFVLIPAQREPDIVGVRGGIKKGKTIEKECAYIADFTYYDKDGAFHVEDVKGMKDGAAYNLFVIKRKLMLFLYGIKIHEI